MSAASLTISPADPAASPAAPVSRPALAGWLDLPTAAARMGMSVGHVRRLCGEKWMAAGLAKLESVDGGKPQWMIQAQAHPSLAPRSRRDETPEEFYQLPDAKRTVALARLETVKAWRRCRAQAFAQGQLMAQAVKAFLAGRAELRRATLYLWDSRYEMDGVMGLVDQRGTGGAGTGSEVSGGGISGGGASGGVGGGYQPFLDECKRRWLDQGKANSREIYMIACALAEDRGWARPSHRTVRRFLAAIPKPVQIAFRGGPDAFRDTCQPSNERDYTVLRSNQVWVWDHHHLDVHVSFGGKIVRPWLTAAMDVRSRKMVGWAVFAHAPNSDVILAVMAKAFKAYGIPDLFQLDNGEDFVCKAITGMTKEERRKARKLGLAIDATPINGALQELGVKFMLAEAYNARSKPIERQFGSIARSFVRHYQTWCGGSTAEKPERLGEILKSQGPGGSVGPRVPTLEELAAHFDQWVPGVYHKMPSTGHGMDGRSPDVVYAACLGDVRRAADLAIDTACLRKHGPTRVGRDGVRWQGLSFGADATELFLHQGRSVYLRIDPSLQQVSVWDQAGKFICYARANQRIPYLGGVQQHRQAKAVERSRRRKVREYHEVRAKLHETTDQVMSTLGRGADLLQRESAGGGPPPEPGRIVPVRTPVDDQLPALQEAVQRNARRMAAGAESLDLSALRNALPERPGGGRSGYAGGDVPDLSALRNALPERPGGGRSGYAGGDGPDLSVLRNALSERQGGGGESQGEAMQMLRLALNLSEAET